MKTFAVHPRYAMGHRLAMELGSLSLASGSVIAGFSLKSLPLAVIGIVMMLALMPESDKRAKLAKLPASETVKVVIVRRETVVESLLSDALMALVVTATFGACAYLGVSQWLATMAVIAFFVTAALRTESLATLTSNAGTMVKFLDEWDGREHPSVAIARLGFKEEATP